MKILTRINYSQNFNNTKKLIFPFIKKCTSSIKNAFCRHFEFDNKLTK